MGKGWPSFLTSFAFWSLAALLAGVGIGILGFLTGSEAVRLLATLLQPLGALWLRALRLVVLPLVVFQLLTAMTGPTEEEVGRVGGRAASLIVLGSMAVMTVALVLGFFVVPLYEVSPESVTTIRESVTVPMESQTDVVTPGDLGDWLTGLIPTNIFEALVHEQIIQILLVTLVFGLAVNHLPRAQRRPVTEVLHALNEALMVLIRWLLVVTPAGVFSLMLGLALGTGLEAAGVVGGFLLINQGVQLLLVLALYPLAVVFGNTTLRRFARAAAPVQLVAVSTRSSLATMPAQIESGRQHLDFGPTTTGVVVPLCVSFFKITLLITDPIRLLFLAHVFGVSLDPGQVATFLLTVLLINFTELGLPRGGVPFRTVPAYLALGIPIEGLVLLQAVNDIEDYPDTVANATGMFAAATVLSRRDRIRDDRRETEPREA